MLQGFKSFKDKTSIYFEDGITGIVGPNGCGKSNIVDALFWVMGEQSAKHLRGKSMKDVIFAGSTKYGPGTFAEVALVLENITEKHIHIGKKVVSPREIQISRKLYRNGDSEYRINGLPARLRDIQEIFMDTGAGAKSYSVIAQGEVDRLVQSKPEERRSMIEEVAGITKFKLRKRESLRKIEQTNANLARIKDLHSEIYKNLKQLERQAEKAEKARSLKEKVARTDLVVNAHKEFELLKDFTEFNSFIEEKKLKVTEGEARRESLELDIKERELLKTELSAQIESQRQVFNEKSKKLVAGEEKLNYMRRTHVEKVSFIDMKIKENTAILDETKERKARLLELGQQLEELQNTQVDSEGHAQLQTQVQEAEQELKQRRQAHDEYNATLEQNRSSYLAVDQELFKMNLRAKELAQSLQDISTETDAIEKQYSGLSDEISQERTEVNKIKQQVEDLQQGLEGLNVESSSLEKEKKNLGKEVHSMTRELMEKESKLQSLQELNHNYEDQGDGVRELLKNFQDNCTLFAGLIECEEQYTPAVQAALQTRLEAIIPTDRGEVVGSTFFHWLEQKKLGADFLSPRAPAQDFSVAIPATFPLSEVVKLNGDATTAEAARQLLQGIYIAEQWDDDLLNSLEQYHFAVIVAADGKRVVENLGNSLRIRVVGSTGKEQTIIARNNLITQLQDMVATLKNNLEQKRQNLFEISKRDQQVSETKQAQGRELSRAQIDFASRRSALDTKLENLNSGDSRMKILKQRAQEFSRERLDISEEEERTQRKREELKQMVATESAGADEMQREITALTNSYTELKEQLFIKQMEVQTYDEREDALAQQVQDLQGQVSRNLEKLKDNDEVVSKYEEELKDIHDTIEELQERNAHEASELREQEVKLSESGDRLSKQLIEMQKVENEIKKITNDVIKSEKAIIAKETKRDQIIVDEEQVTRNIFEKYQIDLRGELSKSFASSNGELHGLADLSEMYYADHYNEETKEFERVKIEPRPYKFNRRYGQDLKDQAAKLKQYKQALNRIGEINWQAVDNYEEQKRRHQFLKEQESELKASIVDLENAIVKIDEKSRLRFKVAYEEVSVRFEKVFPIIFGGGSAKLKLIGDLQDPECGIDIIAQPPGKKMQNINLMSGGEKALTAVSLIFSIFLVKPSPFCLLDEVDAPLDDANVGRFNELLSEMSDQSQFILITHNKRTMEFNNNLYGITMQEPGISSAVSVQLQ